MFEIYLLFIFQRFTLSSKKLLFDFKRRKEGFSHFRSFRFSFVHGFFLLYFSL